MLLLICHLVDQKSSRKFGFHSERKKNFKSEVGSRFICNLLPAETAYRCKLTMYLHLHVNVNSKPFQNYIFVIILTWEKLWIIITAIMSFIYLFGLIFLSRNSTIKLFSLKQPYYEINFFFLTSLWMWPSKRCCALWSGISGPNKAGK